VVCSLQLIRVASEQVPVESCLIIRLMAIQRLVFNRTSFDHITEELVIALSDGESMEFKDLFTKVYLELKRKKAGSGSEEVLRLRCYDRLLKLAGNGLVEKKERTFRALPGIEQALPAHVNAAAIKRKGDLVGKAADFS
jgi:hypothetical protein